MNSSPSTKSVAVGARAVALVVLARSTESRAAPATADMPVQVVAFEDADPMLNCDPHEARAGECVERVRFLDVSQAWSPNAASEEFQRLLEMLSHLYSQVWDDLAVRWNLESDALVALYQESGVSSLPMTSTLFEGSEAQSERRFSLPARELWLDGARWTGQGAGAASGASAFHTLRYLGPGALPPPPVYVALSGFAPTDGTRALPLTVDEQPVLADLMDADRESSGPFFEQMFPVAVPPELSIESAKRGGIATLDRWPAPVRDRVDLPLWRFVLPDSLRQHDEKVNLAEIIDWGQRPVSCIDSLEAMRERVAGEHDAWALRTALLLRRFADERFTPVHTRMLGALVQILAPPRSLSSDAGGPSVSASGKGQTDSQDRQEEIANEGTVAELSVDRLRLDVLPQNVVAHGLLRLAEREGFSETSKLFREDFIRFVNEGLYVNLRQTGKLTQEGADEPIALNCRDSVPPGLTLVEIDAWSKACAAPALRATVTDQVRRGVLRALLRQLQAESSEAFELEQTRLLLDHVADELGATLQQSVAGMTPSEAEAAAQDVWTAIMERHGRAVRLAESELGAPNPLAVCGKLEREAALGETSIKGVQLDLIVEAADRLDTADQVLWDVGTGAPFLMVDGALGSGVDPREAGRDLETRVGPSVERLFGLPNDRAVYRLRWRLWSGWHLLWGLTDLELFTEDGTQLNRVALRTARICEDTTLAPETLVPTLVRAGLLEEGFRPSFVSSEAPRPRSGPTQAKEHKAQKSNDQMLEMGAQVGAAGVGAVSTGKNMVTGADEGAALETGEDGAELATRTQGSWGDRSTKVGGGSGAWSDLNELLARALGRGQSAAARLTIVAFDVAQEVPRQHVWRWRPRAPYVVQQNRLGWKRYTRGAVWSTTLVKGETAATLRRSSPGYRARGGAQSATEVRVWRRKSTLDLSLVTDLGLMPLRRVESKCDAKVTDDYLGTIETCADGAWRDEGIDSVEWAQGASFGLAPLLGMGIMDQPRLTLEFGPALQLTLVPPWIWGVPRLQGEDTVHHWELSPRAGLVVGARLAPDPLGLARSGDRRLWGVPLEDGSSRLRRLQGGLRLGGYLNPGYSGLEASAGADLWLGWSLRRAYVPQATLTPFHPAILLGPYVSGDWGTLISDIPEDLPEYLTSRWEVMVGVRGQFRLTGKAPRLPEVE